MTLSRRVSLGRIVAQGLVSATAARLPLGAVENLLALQCQEILHGIQRRARRGR